MTLILIWVDTLYSPIRIEEYFLEFLKIYDILGKGLFDELMNVLKKKNILILMIYRDKGMIMDLTWRVKIKEWKKNIIRYKF